MYLNKLISVKEKTELKNNILVLVICEAKNINYDACILRDYHVMNHGIDCIVY